MPSRAFTTKTVALLMAAALSLTACSITAAGSTACGTYRGKATGDRLTTVKEMMDARKLDTSTTGVITTELSVDAYCFTHSADSHIDGIYSA